MKVLSFLFCSRILKSMTVGVKNADRGYENDLCSFFMIFHNFALVQFLVITHSCVHLRNCCEIYRGLCLKIEDAHKILE